MARIIIYCAVIFLLAFGAMFLIADAMEVETDMRQAQIQALFNAP